MWEISGNSLANNKTPFKLKFMTHTMVDSKKFWIFYQYSLNPGALFMCFNSVWQLYYVPLTGNIVHRTMPSLMKQQLPLSVNYGNVAHGQSDSIKRTYVYV